MRSGACLVGKKNRYNVRPSESCINLLLIAGSELNDWFFSQETDQIVKLGPKAIELLFCTYVLSS